MKVIIVSDSHGKRGILEELVERHKDAQCFLHCGDIECGDEEYPEYIKVNGNNDFFSTFPNERVVGIGGHRIYMAHGHMLPFRNRLENLVRKAKEKECDIACFGHTHVALLTKMDGITVINPGSLWRSRDGRGPSYCVLEINGDDVTASIMFLN